MPVIADTRTYGTMWVKWWTAAQPKERDIRQWPFPRNPDDKINWRRFPANGKDGLFITIMALSWWALAVQSPDEIVLFEEAVVNINWVIQEVICIKATDQISSSCPSPLQDKPIPHQVRPRNSRPKPTPRQPAPPSRPRASAPAPPVSTSGGERATGKQVVKPTWKAAQTT